MKKKDFGKRNRITGSILVIICHIRPFEAILDTAITICRANGIQEGKHLNQKTTKMNFYEKNYNLTRVLKGLKRPKIEPENNQNTDFPPAI